VTRTAGLFIERSTEARETFEAPTCPSTPAETDAKLPATEVGRGEEA